MAGLGGVLILLSLFGLYWNWRGTLASKSTYLKILVATFSSRSLPILLDGLCLKLVVNLGL